LHRSFFLLKLILFHFFIGAAIQFFTMNPFEAAGGSGFEFTFSKSTMRTNFQAPPPPEPTTPPTFTFNPLPARGPTKRAAMFRTIDEAVEVYEAQCQKIIDLEKEISGLKKGKADDKNSFLAVTAERDSAISSLAQAEKQLAASEDQRRTLTKDKTEALAAKDELAERIKSIEASATESVKIARDAVQNQIKAETTASSLEIDVEELHEDYEALKCDYADLKEEKNNLQEANEQLQKNYDNLEEAHRLLGENFLAKDDELADLKNGTAGNGFDLVVTGIDEVLLSRSTTSPNINLQELVEDTIEAGEPNKVADLKRVADYMLDVIKAAGSDTSSPTVGPVQTDPVDDLYDNPIDTENTIDATTSQATQTATTPNSFSGMQLVSETIPIAPYQMTQATQTEFIPNSFSGIQLIAETIPVAPSQTTQATQTESIPNSFSGIQLVAETIPVAPSQMTQATQTEAMPNSFSGIQLVAETIPTLPFQPGQKTQGVQTFDTPNAITKIKVIAETTPIPMILPASMVVRQRSGLVHYFVVVTLAFVAVFICFSPEPQPGAFGYGGPPVDNSWTRFHARMGEIAAKWVGNQGTIYM
jgi:FtsZ-binding cell division protein ZapB